MISTSKEAHILFALYGSFPDMKTGYAVRSHNLVKSLRAQGIKVTVATMAGFPDGCQVDSRVEYDGVVYHRIGQSGEQFELGPAHREEARKGYAEFIRAHGITLVHAASSAENGWAAVMAARDCGVPSVYEYRGLWHYTGLSRIPWHDMTEEYANLHSLELETGHLADKVIAISGALAAHLAKLGIDRSKISVAPNAVDITAHVPSPRDEALAAYLGLKDKLVVGFAGSITIYEGLDLLVDAAIGLRAAGLPVSLLILGDGPYLAHLKRLCQERQANDCVVFTGRVNVGLVPNYYSIMDVIALPRLPLLVSRTVPPLKPLEAFAQGKALVAPDLPPFLEMVEHNKTGVIFEAGNLTSLYKELKYILENPELRAKLGKNGRKWVAENRQWSHVTEKFLNVYQGLGLPVLKNSQETRKLAIHPETAGWLKVAGIMDEFNCRDFCCECVLLQLEPDKWREQLEEFKPDLLFVESAWKGKDDLWQKQISGCSDTLRELFAWCKSRDIPTMFWGKEDPAHFDTFIQTASLADFIFTIDVDCVPQYKRITGNDKVYFLPFGFQPRNHNPIEKYERKNRLCFAGSYYRRYAYRQQVFDGIFQRFNRTIGFDIYDRQYGKDDYFYKFPECYAPFILGNLPPAEIDKAYKGYAYSLTLNSLPQSQSMFARRAFELAASNTVIISNYSKGLRNIFGDLAICGDNPGALAKKLDRLSASENYKRKFLAQALRLALQNHTTRHRLEYIREKVWNIPPDAPAKILLVARADNEGEAHTLMNAFSRQEWPGKILLLCGPDREISSPGIICRRTLNEARQMAAALDYDYLGYIDTRDYYGSNYLADLALAFTYADAGAASREAHYVLANGQLNLLNDGAQYKYGKSARIASSLFVRDAEDMFWQALESGANALELDAFNINEFNYVKNGAHAGKAALEDADDSQMPHDNLFSRMVEFAEKLPPSPMGKDYNERLNLSFLPELDIDRIKESPKYKIRQSGLTIRITSTLGPNEKVKLPGLPLYRKDINMSLSSQVNVRLRGNLRMRVIVCYLGNNKEYLANEVLEKGNNLLRIPDQCAFMAFDCEITGGGEGSMGPFYAPRLFMSQESILFNSDVGIITKRYPDYDDIYNYAFVHNRMLGYRNNRKNYQLIQFPLLVRNFREFEDIDISGLTSGELYNALASGQMKVVGIHLINNIQWKAVKAFLDEIKLVIWVHGADVRSWKRKAFDFDILDKKAQTQLMRNAERALNLFREIISLDHKNIHFVLVSKTLLKEAETDIGVPFPRERTHIIHNYIDSDFYKCAPKSSEDRFKVIAIRPFVSKTYAADLAVNAILAMRDSHLFKKFSFSFYGDGELFESTIEPLRALPNVHIEKRFLQRGEMKNLYQKHGICLVPTRLDSQGVSRDEAMACGLVPITTDVSAVSEFVDAECGFLAPPEDAQAMANAMLKLGSDPDLFLRMSAAAAARPRSQCGYENTIAREIDLIERLRINETRY